MQFAKSRRQPLRLFNLFCFNNFSRKWWLIIIAIVKYNLLTILKLQHDISRPCYRPIIKVQNPNLRIFSPLSPCLPSPLRLSLSSLCDKTIIEWFPQYTLKNILLKFAISTSRPTAARLILQIFAKYFSMYTEKSFNNCIISYNNIIHFRIPNIETQLKCNVDVIKTSTIWVICV